jgi:hypothetical protein
MPSGKQWFEFLFVNVVFVFGLMVIVLLTFIKKIKKNWPLYRCNPMYMPFSDDMQTDFTYCVQNMQGNMMGDYMQPMNYLMSNTSLLSGAITDQLNDMRKMTSNMRGFQYGSTFSIFSVFNNIIIEFQKIMYGMNDIFGKLTGILVTFLYSISTIFDTTSSLVNGPIGLLLGSAGKGKSASSCFHPDTMVRLTSGQLVPMKDIHLGDVLESGSVVEAVMRVDNMGNETFYEICDSSQEEPIYVTGSHYLYSEKYNMFVPVSRHEDAKPTKKQQPLWFSCLITDNHKIQIGNRVFWDWEDWRIHFTEDRRVRNQNC